MAFSLKDWIHHPTFGDGQITEDRGDKFLVRFPELGEKIIVKSVIILPGHPPHPGFEFALPRSTRRSRFRVEPPKREPPLDFDHLVKRFLDVFANGFQSVNFDERERKYKEDAGELLRRTLSAQLLRELLDHGHHDQVVRLAREVLQATNLVFPQEKMRFNDALKEPKHKELFAMALWHLMYSTEDLQQRFDNYIDVLLTVGAPSWTVATYFQFLHTSGRLMFMKPAVTQKMAYALGFALNYKTQPNWLTYSKLQELAARVDDELRKRGLRPESGIDVQGFIWASIKIENGQYGTNGIIV